METKPNPKLSLVYALVMAVTVIISLSLTVQHTDIPVGLVAPLDWPHGYSCPAVNTVSTQWLWAHLLGFSVTFLFKTPWVGQILSR